MVHTLYYIGTYLSKPVVSIRLLSTATELYGMEWGLIQNSAMTKIPCCLFMLVYACVHTFHLQGPSLVRTQHSYTLSINNVPYSGEKRIFVSSNYAWPCKNGLVSET